MAISKEQPAKAHILIVDDEEGIREMFKETLEDCGYACQTAPNAAAALETLSSSAIDLLLLDILMPEMNGLACFEHIRDSYPDVAVIFVTAMDDVAVGVDTILAGAYDYLVKPTTAQRLEQAVEGVLTKRATLMEERRERELLEEEQARRLEQRGQELTALNHLFQQHLKEHFTVVEAYRDVLDRFSRLVRHVNTRYKMASWLHLPPRVKVQSSSSRNTLERLTARQREVLDLVAQGYSDAAIARRLALAEKSVGELIKDIYEQLRVGGSDMVHPRVQAVLIYLQQLRND